MNRSRRSFFGVVGAGIAALFGKAVPTTATPAAPLPETLVEALTNVSALGYPPLVSPFVYPLLTPCYPRLTLTPFGHERSVAAGLVEGRWDGAGMHGIGHEWFDKENIGLSIAELREGKRPDLGGRWQIVRLVDRLDVDVRAAVVATEILEARFAYADPAFKYFRYRVEVWYEREGGGRTWGIPGSNVWYGAATREEAEAVVFQLESWLCAAEHVACSKCGYRLGFVNAPIQEKMYDYTNYICREGCCGRDEGDED